MLATTKRTIAGGLLALGLLAANTFSHGTPTLAAPVHRSMLRHTALLNGHAQVEIGRAALRNGQVRLLQGRVRTPYTSRTLFGHQLLQGRAAVAMKASAPYSRHLPFGKQAAPDRGHMLYGRTHLLNRAAGVFRGGRLLQGHTRTPYMVRTRYGRHLLQSRISAALS